MHRQTPAEFLSNQSNSYLEFLRLVQQQRGEDFRAVMAEIVKRAQAVAS